MLHPIKALDHVIDSYRDYLVTEFRARDARLQDELQDALTRDNFLAREPFFSAHTAFESGRAWEAFGLDDRLAAALRKRAGGNASYLHQSLAIEHLLGGSPTPLVVSTGTGSGKTEAFLAPVLHSAIEDAITHKNRAGMVAILLYPMNALANDQLERIKWYLRESGWDGTIRVEQYNRGTSQEDREKMRQNPPHILLTNYQMLEYLLVRPADRDALFKQHRMRFVVLDEVHTYGGTLGTHVALLIRRLRAHLRRANARQHPVFVGASATIAEDGASGIQRDEAIQTFFGRLVGETPSSIKVVSEAKVKVDVPTDAQYALDVHFARDLHDYDLDDAEDLRQVIVALAGLPADTVLDKAVRRCRLLWDLNRWLAQGAQPVSALVNAIRAEVRERVHWSDVDIQAEIELGLRAGAAIAANGKADNALRLRAHRFVRGGWQFYRCLNPECGTLHPRGESQCVKCGSPTAPLYLCRICGADFLRLQGPQEGAGKMHPHPEVYNAFDDGYQPNEWLLYHQANWSKVDFELEDDGDGDPAEDEGGRPARPGSYEPVRGHWDVDEMNFIPTDEGKSYLFPTRRRCPHCGSRGWPRYVITPVSLGTSAAMKVLTEGIVEALPGDDKKRVLIFADSRQDAAHQARYINFAARYDRMRSRVYHILREAGQPMTLNAVIEKLGQFAAEAGDNPYLRKLPNGKYVIPRGAEEREVYLAWEEAPLLDNLALNTRYRAALENLGLVAVDYAYLDEFAASAAGLAHGLGIAPQHMGIVTHQILDAIRKRGALSRTLLQYHPDSVSKQQVSRGAEWERGVREPIGLPAAVDGSIALRLSDELPPGVRVQTIWSIKGQATNLQKVAEHLAERLVGLSPTADGLLSLMQALVEWQFLKAVDLYGYRGKPIQLYQLNDGMVELSIATDENRCRCTVCGRITHVPRWLHTGGDLPCPHCSKGILQLWDEESVQRSRYVKRTISAASIPLRAAEHTAQVPGDRRNEIETAFKSPDEVLNVLACSPTLELGIHVGGLEAVALRNVPPRPDNYAQRGGRAGRDERVGLVVGYTRNTPHDQYFFQHPDEMIAGAVPAPVFNLGNRDAIARHLSAIAFGLADPGVAGKMKEYVTFKGEINEEAVADLLNGLRSARDAALEIAEDAFSADVLAQTGYSRNDLAAILDDLPRRVEDAVHRTALQVRRLYDTIENWTEIGGAGGAANRAGRIINNLLGIEDAYQSENLDVGSAYPLRRLAESGILPGYEFPVEPSTLRLLSDKDEWSTLSTARPAGLHQYQPGAPVYARGKRWKVVGLDLSSPWNPQGKEPTWNYLRCEHCDLAYDPQVSPRCPRCNQPSVGKPQPAFDYAGFIARPDDSLVSDEEDRIFSRNLVETHPSWQTDPEQPVRGRWQLPDGWLLERRQGETVVWLNEGVPDNKGMRVGYRLCPDCGKMIAQPVAEKPKDKGRKAPGNGSKENALGHSENCPRKGQPLAGISLYAEAKVETLRLLFIWPGSSEDKQAVDHLTMWALTLGYALLAGAERHFALAPGDLDFLWEGLRAREVEGVFYNEGIITFIDPNVGGSGYLARMAEEFHLVAGAALHHLDHDDCESACYRCLKSYTNQRFHDRLHWPSIISTLQGLAAVTPSPITLNAADKRDPRPWFEAFQAGCDSPLEHRVLTLLQSAGVDVEQQVAIPAVQPFTIADFAIPEKRVAIYVDGLAFHTADRLRRDKAIQRRLESLDRSWRVVRITANDLNNQLRVDALISFLRFPE